MTSMSYCRFENTLRDMADCQHALENLFAGDGRLSASELRHAKALVQCCRDILDVVADQACIDMDEEEALERLASGLDDIMDEANDAAEGGC